MSTRIGTHPTVRRTGLLGGILAAVAGGTLLFTTGAANAATVPVASAGPAAAPDKVIDVLSCEELAAAEVLIQGRIVRIAGDATVVGSTAWVEAELATAVANGDAKRAARLQRILDYRQAHPDRPANRLARVQQEQAERC